MSMQGNITNNDQLMRLKADIECSYLCDEKDLLQKLVAGIGQTALGKADSETLAERLIDGIQQQIKRDTGFAALLRHYDLSTPEGVALMCLAEALLRIPDSDTVDELIADKLAAGQWQQHLGQSDSLFVNASTWAFMLSGRLLKQAEQPEYFLPAIINKLDAPLFRVVIKQAMQFIAEQFVMGSDINKALQRAQQNDHYLYSYDMLGEAALTAADAQRYQQAYLDAIAEIGQSCDKNLPIQQRPGISVKLSALYPRYEYRRRAMAISHLSTALLELATAARSTGITLTVDAEEAERLEMSLDIFEQVYLTPSLAGWPGLGLAVQAYQKRALPVLNYLSALAQQGGRQIPVRLVKGAYWDVEIKRAQQQGLSDYPVFTRKCHTDISYLACAKYLLQNQAAFYPQFATHNAYSVALIINWASTLNGFEFQRLHGMGEALYEQLLTDRVAIEKPGKVQCRVYAPVGAYRELLPYLVRRLLENGANSSFVNQMAHPQQLSTQQQAISELLAGGRAINNPMTIPLPGDIFGAERHNSEGVNFASAQHQHAFVMAVNASLGEVKGSQAIISGVEIKAPATQVFNPADRQQHIAQSQILTATEVGSIEQALAAASAAWPQWRDSLVPMRAEILAKAAELFTRHRAELVALCAKEAGKTIEDSLADVREAIDFLRYYACQAINNMAEPLVLPGYTGESNELLLQGRGVFLCISPWNFPVAIFTGQIAAALVTGNCVLAKPSSQTTLTARRVIDLLFQAGVPASVLHYLPCEAELLSTALIQDQRLAGVAFTGSGQVARQISRQLASRDGAIVPLIAETGGQNVLMADSSAQPEQLVADVITSAFNSAGQRCSALRVLYVDEEIAERVIELLTGAMDELLIGDPLLMTTDVGPVIDEAAQAKLNQYIHTWQQQGRLLYQCTLPPGCDKGSFVAPTLLEIDSIGQLSEERFGPVLHLVRYQSSQLDEVIDDINACGFGLTFGLHSRIEHRIQQIQRRIRVGNIYINRDIIGAVVGAQPFGGQGLSGTGPKAGGPHYLMAFSTEQTRTTNTAAVGGNMQLLGGLDTRK